MFDFIVKEKPEFFRYFQVANFSSFKVTPYFEIFIKNAENAPGCPNNIIFHNASHRKSISHFIKNWDLIVNVEGIDFYGFSTKKKCSLSRSRLKHIPK